MRRFVLVAVATLAFTPSRAFAQAPPPSVSADHPTMSVGCVAGSFAGGSIVRMFLPLVTTFGAVVAFAGTAMAGCAVGAVAGGLTTEGMPQPSQDGPR